MYFRERVIDKKKLFDKFVVKTPFKLLKNA